MSAYPGSDLKKLVRTFVYDRTGAGSLAVTDDYAFSSSQDFELALTTRAKWKRIAPDKIEFDGKKEKMVATITGAGDFEVKSETIEENCLPFTRIGIVLKPSVAGSVTISFVPFPEK